jgi:hypothetical protein
MPVQTAEADCGLNHPSFVSCLLRGGSYLDILGRTERAKKTGVTVLRLRTAQLDFVLHLAPPFFDFFAPYLALRSSSWRLIDALRRRPSAKHSEFASLSECFVSCAIS